MKRNTRLHNAVFSVLAAIGTSTLVMTVLLIAAGTAMAQEADPHLMVPIPGQNQQYSPYVDQTFPDRVLWGSTHIHTALSADAGLMGVTLGPADMFRYCQGRGSHHQHRLASQTGPTAGLARHHRPCRILGSGRSNSHWQPRPARQPDAASDGTTCPRRARQEALKAACEVFISIAKDKDEDQPASAQGLGLGGSLQGSRAVSTSRAFSPRFTASNGLPCPAATIFIAPSFSATTWTA